MDVNPIHSALYRVGPKARQFEKNEIDKMFSERVVEAAQSEWAAPIVFEQKKYGSLHFCVDYRNLNAVNRRDVYQISCIDECISLLRKATALPTLDMNSEYC